MPIDSVALLEATASYPHVTVALAELSGMAVARVSNQGALQDDGTVNEDVAHLSQRFASLMEAYAVAISDGIITPAEARRMLAETRELQKVLVEMKMHLETNAGDG